MRTGWFFDGDDIYYLGGENQGYAKTGWQCLDYDEEDKPEDGDISEARSSASDSSKWFYFQSNGKAKGQMTVPTQSKPSMTGNIILMRTAL